MQKDPTPESLRFAVLATDIALFTLRNGELLVRLIKVDRPPYFPNTKGMPGGLIDPKETAEDAALRLVRDKAGVHSGHIYIEQLATFSAIDRDPRGRVVAVAHLALAPWESLSEEETADDQNAWWSPPTSAKKLAYDHDEMLALAVSRLRSRASYTTIVSKLMPKEFTLTELEEAYERIIGHGLDKRNFRKKILKLDILKKLPHKRQAGRSRPAALYTFASKKVIEMDML